MIGLILAAAVAATRPTADPVRVGSKIDVETAILEQVAVQRLKSVGVPATAVPPLGGTPVVYAALVAGKVDAYPDYTGTIAAAVLHDPSLTTDAGLRDALAKQQIGMTDSLGFDDTYAIGMADAQAEQLGIRSIADLARHPELRLAFSTEFAGRPDGWPGVRAAYGLPDRPIQQLDHAIAYRGLFAGQLDVTDLYSTDAEIKQHHLRVLADDRHFFPAYRAVYLYRLDLEQRSPAAVAALRSLAGRIDAGRMQAMNAARKVDGRDEAAVAADFLHDTFGTSTAAATPSMAAQLWHLTVGHLLLVGVSLGLAIAVALPLGIVAGEFARVGQGVLVVVAALYTVPSLALLALMVSIPHLGLWWPATIALFLYSLLPIVRNTQAGLRAVPPQLRESAEVLGLTRWARLWRIEVPMAMPAILAGIKTAAVLNVGTATLGGLVGAGGYGEAIFQGIIFSSRAKLLLGAIPAAVMALAIQGGFDLLEPLVVPRGLRLRRPPV